MATHTHMDRQHDIEQQRQRTRIGQLGDVLLEAERPNEQQPHHEQHQRPQRPVVLQRLVRVSDQGETGTNALRSMTAARGTIRCRGRRG